MADIFSEFCCESMQTAQTDGNIHKDSDGDIVAPGCCGGGCNILNYIKFCPFCGKEIRLLEK